MKAPVLVEDFSKCSFLSIPHENMSIQKCNMFCLLTKKPIFQKSRHEKTQQRGGEFVKLLYKQHTDHTTELISHSFLFLSTAIKSRHDTKYLLDFRHFLNYSLDDCSSFATSYESITATSIKTDFLNNNKRKDFQLPQVISEHSAEDSSNT